MSRVSCFLTQCICHTLGHRVHYTVLLMYMVAQGDKVSSFVGRLSQCFIVLCSKMRFERLLIFEI